MISSLVCSKWFTQLELCLYTFPPNGVFGNFRQLVIQVVKAVDAETGFRARERETQQRQVIRAVAEVQTSHHPMPHCVWNNSHILEYWLVKMSINGGLQEAFFLPTFWLNGWYRHLTVLQLWVLQSLWFRLCSVTKC